MKYLSFKLGSDSGWGKVWRCSLAIALKCLLHVKKIVLLLLKTYSVMSSNHLGIEPCEGISVEFRILQSSFSVKFGFMFSSPIIITEVGMKSVC